MLRSDVGLTNGYGGPNNFSCLSVTSEGLIIGHLARLLVFLRGDLVVCFFWADACCLSILSIRGLSSYSLNWTSGGGNSTCSIFSGAYNPFLRGVYKSFFITSMFIYGASSPCIVLALRYSVTLLTWILGRSLISVL